MRRKTKKRGPTCPSLGISTPDIFFCYLSSIFKIFFLFLFLKKETRNYYFFFSGILPSLKSTHLSSLKDLKMLSLFALLVCASSQSAQNYYFSTSAIASDSNSGELAILISKEQLFCFAFDLSLTSTPLRNGSFEALAVLGHGSEHHSIKICHSIVAVGERLLVG